MKFRNLIGLMVLILLTSSCAYIFTGNKSKVFINSVPPGATILVNGMEEGTTPATIKLKRSMFDVTTVTLKLKDYENKTIEPETTFQPVTVLNLANPVGWAIDIATGTIVKYSPNNYEVELKPISK